MNPIKFNEWLDNRELNLTNGDNAESIDLNSDAAFLINSGKKLNEAWRNIQ